MIFYKPSDVLIIPNISRDSQLQFTPLFLPINKTMSASVKSNNTGALIQREAWYRNPTVIWILKAAAINFVLPFFNGVMLGFGEILANEVIFKYGWFGYARPQLGINAIPASATKDFRKSIETQIKHEQKKEKDELLLLD